MTARSHNLGPGKTGDEFRPADAELSKLPTPALLTGLRDEYFFLLTKTQLALSQFQLKCFLSGPYSRPDPRIAIQVLSLDLLRGAENISSTGTGYRHCAAYINRNTVTCQPRNVPVFLIYRFLLKYLAGL